MFDPAEPRPTHAPCLPLKEGSRACRAPSAPPQKAFGFSFSRGRNAHFPGTGQAFHDGVKRYLSGDGGGGGGGGGASPSAVLDPVEVAFPGYGKVVILGRVGAAAGT